MGVTRDQGAEAVQHRPVVALPDIAREIQGRGLVGRHALLGDEVGFEEVVPLAVEREQLGDRAVMLAAADALDLAEAILDIGEAFVVLRAAQDCRAARDAEILSPLFHVKQVAIDQRSQRVERRRVQPVGTEVDRRAERDAVRDDAPADVRLGLQQAERCAFVLQAPRRGQAGRACADDDDVQHCFVSDLLVDRLELVAVGVGHEGSIVGRAVVRPRAGRAFIAPARRSAAAWKASTAARLGASKARWKPAPGGDGLPSGETAPAGRCRPPRHSRRRLRCSTRGRSPRPPARRRRTRPPSRGRRRRTRDD